MSAHDNRPKCKFSRHINQTALYLRKFQLVITRAVQNFKSLQQNCFVLEKSLPRGNRDSLNFQVTSSKLPYVLQKLQLLIIVAVQIFKWHQQNFILGKILPHHNKGKCEFSIDFLKLIFFKNIYLVITGIV